MGADSAYNIGIDAVNIQCWRICGDCNVQLRLIFCFPCPLCSFCSLGVSCSLSRISRNHRGGLLLCPAGLTACSQHHSTESKGKQTEPFPVFHNSKTFLSDRYRYR